MMEDLKGLKAAIMVEDGALRATARVGPHLFNVFREL